MAWKRRRISRFKIWISRKIKRRSKRKSGKEKNSDKIMERRRIKMR